MVREIMSPARPSRSERTPRRLGRRHRGRSGPGEAAAGARARRCGPRRCSRRRSTSATSRRAPAARTPTRAPSTPPCATSRPPSASSTAAAACPSPPAWRRSPPPSSPFVGAGDRVVLPVRRLLHDPAARRRRARALRRAGRLRAHPGDRGGRGPRRPRRRPAGAAGDPEQPPARRLRHRRGRRGRPGRPGRSLAVDNTTATPLGQRPLELGADLTVGSDTKALTGHSDLLLGHVSTTDDELYARIARLARPHRQHPGAVRGVARAPLDEHPRPAARPAGGQRGRGRRGAGRLAGGPRRPVAVAGRRTRRTRWPPGRCCGRTAWSPPSWPTRPPSRTLLGASRLWTAATSFGGVHSTIDRRAQWGGGRRRPGVRPAVLRDRGHRRPRRRPSARARRALG